MANLRADFLKLAEQIGGYKVSRWLTSASPKILMYHRFSKEPCQGFVHREAFERHLEYLKNNFNVITMHQLIKGLLNEEPLPKNVIVITIDDGYCDFYDIAYPALKKIGLPATFFIPTRFVDGDFWLWPDKIQYILKHSKKIKLDGLSGSFSNGSVEKNRGLIWHQIIDHLLTINDDEKHVWINQLAINQNVPIPEVPNKEYSAVTWKQVKEMSTNNIEIGAHSRTHPSLTKVNNELLQYELNGCMDDIKNKTGSTPTSFCYPNGQPTDYNEAIKKQIRDVGCQGAVTAFYDRELYSDIFELRRFKACEDWAQFIKVVNGIEVLTAKWLNEDNIMMINP